MEFIDALRYFLNTSSLSVSQRVYHRRAPEQPAVPYLVLSEMAPRPLHVQTGAVSTIQRSVQFSIFAGGTVSTAGGGGQAEAATIAKALRQLLDGFSGLMGPVGDTCNVRSALWESQVYNYEPDTKLHMEALDFRFQWYE